MVKRQTIFHGYRGTNKYWGMQCKHHNKFKISTGKDEYFGNGIYFFENDHIEAYNWAKFRQNYKDSDISVIYALIETDRVLDFFMNDTFKDYLRIVKNTIERYNQSGIGIVPKFKKPFDCGLINAICKKGNYLLVRGPYQPDNKLGTELFEEGYTRIKKTHIQLCVKDQCIIKECEVSFF